MTLKKTSELINQYAHIDDSVIGDDTTYSSTKLEAVLSRYVLANDHPFITFDKLLAGYKIQLDHDSVANTLTINALIDEGSEDLYLRLAKLKSLANDMPVLGGIGHEDPSVDPSKTITSKLNILLRTLIDPKFPYYKSLVTEGELWDPDGLYPTPGDMNTSNFRILFNIQLRDIKDLTKLISLHKNTYAGPLPDQPFNVGFSSLFNILLRDNDVLETLVSLKKQDQSYPPIVPYNADFKSALQAEHNRTKVKLDSYIDTTGDYRPNISSNLDMKYTPKVRSYGFDTNQLPAWNHDSSALPIDVPYGVDIEINRNVLGTRSTSSISNKLVSPVYVTTTDVNGLLDAPTSFSWRLRTGNVPIDVNILSDQTSVKVSKVVFKIVDPDDQSIHYALLNSEGVIDYNFEHDKVYKTSVAYGNSYSDTLYGEDYSSLNYSLIQNMDVDEYTWYLTKDSHLWAWSQSSFDLCTFTVDEESDIATLVLDHSSVGSVWIGTYISLLPTSKPISQLQNVHISFDIQFYGYNYTGTTQLSDGYGILNGVNYSYSTYNNIINPRNVWLGAIAPNCLSIPATNPNVWESVDITSDFKDNHVVKRNDVSCSFITSNTDNNYRTFSTSHSKTTALYRSAIRNTAQTYSFAFGMMNQNRNASYHKTMLIRNFKLIYRPQLAYY
jgi:hypothetical protein